MNGRYACVVTLAAGLFIAIPASLLAQAARAYRVEDIGSLGGSSIVGEAINNNGDIAGWASLAGDTTFHAFRWTESAGLEDLGANGGRYSRAYGINDNGDVVGYYVDNEWQMHGFIAPRGGVMRDLWTTDRPILQVTSITNDGRMTGVMLRLDPFSRIGFRTLADGSLQQLGTTGFDSVGWDMNDAGEATGYELRSVNGLDETAFRFSDGAGHLNIGTLGGGRSGGQAINNAGVVVGWSESAVDGSWSRAFRARPGLPMEDLGTIWGLNAAATAINEAGDITGWSEGGAFVYTDADGMVSLNSRVAAYPWRPLYAATGINNGGQIVVSFYTDGLGTGTARLVPVIDKEPPVITFIDADPDVLMPADGRMRLVRVSGAVTDDFDPSPRCAIASVTNSEAPSSGPDPDVEITGAVTVMLRASRLGMNTGRAYTIRVGCTDSSGNLGTADVAVRVPHDNRSN